MNFSASARARGTRGVGETEPSQRRAGNNFKNAAGAPPRTAALDTARRPTRRPTRGRAALGATSARARSLGRETRDETRAVADARGRFAFASTRTVDEKPAGERDGEEDHDERGFALAGLALRPGVMLDLLRRAQEAAADVVHGGDVRRCARAGRRKWREGRPPGRSLPVRYCFNRCFRAPARQPQVAIEKKESLLRHAGTERGSARLVPSTERARHQRSMRRVIQDPSSPRRVIEPTTADRFVP